MKPKLLEPQAGRVDLTRHGRIAKVTVCNAARRNAVTIRMWRAIPAIFDELARDGSVRAVVLCGEGGRAFISGADISEFDSARAGDTGAEHYDAMVAEALQAIADIPKPTIAMINGYCLGAGLEVAVRCDIRFADETSQFGIPAAKIGLGFPLDEIREIVRVIGLSATKDILFSGRRFNVAEAFRYGLVNQVFGADTLEAKAFEYAELLADNAPLTILAIKKVLGELAREPAERNFEECQLAIRRCSLSADYAEGRKAFAEKRAPIFEGR
jgi:enoyl-CoA hydratase